MKQTMLGMMIMFAATTGAAISACSSDSTTSPTTTTPDGGGTTTVRIKAAEGGTVADPGGTAKLTIPAGSLEKDTDITLKLSAAGGQALTQVYEFGPDGTKFTKPATLEIKADAKLAPEGKTLAVGIGAGSTFTAIEGSTYAGGLATAPVAHFTSFSVIFVDGKAVIVPAKECAALRANFAPCGGDPKGTWTYETLCLTPETGGPKESPDPFNGRCPGYKFEGTTVFVGEVTIDATSVTSSAAQLKGTSVLTIPLKCFSDLPDGGTYDSGINDCATVQQRMFTKDGGATATCVDAGGGICTCTSTESVVEIPGNTQTYTVSGNSLSSTNAKGEVSTSDFCVQGDNLTSLQTKAGVDPAKATLYNLKRK